MPNNRDAILLETVKTHRARLLAAFVYGALVERRVTNDNLKRVLGSIVLAAVACAGCVGFSLVSSLLSDQAAAKQAQAGNGPATAAPFAADTFDRTTTGGWGTAELGGAWTAVGPAADLAVAGGTASLRVPDGDPRGAYLGAGLRDAADTTVTVRRTDATGAVTVSVLGRRVSSTQDYRANVRLGADGSTAVWLSRRSEPTRPDEPAETRLSDTVTLLGGTEPGQEAVPVTVRFQVAGTDPTVVRAKVWGGGTEPGGWTVAANDSSAGLQRPGTVGLTAVRSEGRNPSGRLAVSDVVARPTG